MGLIVVVSVFTTAPQPEQIKPFIWNITWLRTWGEGEVKRPWYQSLKLWLALYALAWCYIYWRFW